VGRFLAALLAAVLVGACQNETHPQFSPPPSPSPHLEPTAAILQPSDVPAGLAVCQGSGPMDVYVSVMATLDSTVAQRVEQQWELLLNAGATSGAIAVYTATPAACKAELGATSNVKAMASFVARFADESQAEQAWHTGVLGFVPPAPGQLTSGLVLGTNSGLGASSFTYDRPSVRLACWRHGLFVALVVASNLDLTAFKTATAAVDPRLN
jgi:hypothetical protein